MVVNKHSTDVMQMKIRGVAYIFTASIIWTTPALAQIADGATVTEAASSSRVIYDQAYFSTHEVQNAQDMLRRVPGVSAILAALGGVAQNRGFGSGGDQVLLNGRRFPGKSNGILKALARLRADSVERVELIRGTSSDIDVLSSGVVVNIVLREGASLEDGGTFELALRGNDEGALGVDGLVNYAGSTGRLGFNAGIERNLWTLDANGAARWTNRFRDEVYLYPDGSVQELRPQFWDRSHDKWVFTGGLTYDLPGGARGQLNGLYETRDVVEFDRTSLTRFDPQGVQLDSAIEEHSRRSGPVKSWELSIEFTAPLWGGGLTVLLIRNSQELPSLDDRIRIHESAVREISNTRTYVKRSEYIGRVQYRIPFSSVLGLNLGGESSNNKLEQNLTAAFDINADGMVEPIAIPTSNAGVEELRGEGFVDLKWDLSSAVAVSGSINYEYSKLTTNSIFNPGRSLGFWKPRLDVRYIVSGAGLLRLLAEKWVSQLDFANFVPRYNVLDDRIDAGNPGLLPEQVWNFEVGYEHRLPNDVGVVEGMLFYQDISDAIDFIPLQQGATIVSAQGNLGEAWNYGAEVTASLRLVPLGLRDAVLTLAAEMENSSITDPFTGQRRKLRHDSTYDFSIGFRHDVRALNLSYGFDYKNMGSYRVHSDLFSRDVFRIGPLLSVFAEKRIAGSLVLRGEAQNLLGGNEYRERQIFAVNQIDGEIRRLDSLREARDLRYAIKLRGTY